MGTIINLFGKLSKKGKIIAAIVTILIIAITVSIFPVISHARQNRYEKEYETMVEDMKREHQQKFLDKQTEYDKIGQQWHR